MAKFMLPSWVTTKLLVGDVPGDGRIVPAGLAVACSPKVKNEQPPPSLPPTPSYFTLAPFQRITPVFLRTTRAARAALPTARTVQQRRRRDGSGAGCLLDTIV